MRWLIAGISLKQDMSCLVVSCFAFSVWVSWSSKISTFSSISKHKVVWFGSAEAFYIYFAYTDEGSDCLMCFHVFAIAFNINPNMIARSWYEKLVSISASSFSVTQDASVIFYYGRGLAFHLFSALFVHSCRALPQDSAYCIRVLLRITLSIFSHIF